jgi:hypothetical protein
MLKLALFLTCAWRGDEGTFGVHCGCNAGTKRETGDQVMSSCTSAPERLHQAG